MAKRRTYLIEWFVQVHGLAGVLFSCSAYLSIHCGRGVHSASYLTLLWMALIVCWLTTFAACFGYRKRAHRLAVRDRLAELRRLPWHVLEQRVAQAFRLQGYVVERVGLADVEAGLDLILHKHGATTLVQCRRWQQRRVHVKDVHEMYNLVRHRHACAAKIVACGDYTEDAWKFVVGKPFELIYGETLLAMFSDERMTAFVAATGEEVAVRGMQVNRQASAQRHGITRGEPRAPASTEAPTRRHEQGTPGLRTVHRVHGTDRG